MGSNLILYDGDYSRPVPVGAPRTVYPFRQFGDRVTKGFEQDYWQWIVNYSPGPLGTVWDEDRTLYFVSESNPVQFLAGLYQFTRTFSRIPTPQTVPTSLQLSKPALSGSFPQVIGAYRVFQPDTTLLTYDAYAAQVVTSDSGAASSFYPTGGTYTISFLGQTTGAIAYNALPAAVQTALNLLSNITDRGSVTVSGSYNSAGGFTITFGAYAAVSVALGSLTGDTGSSATSSFTSNNRGYSQAFRINRTNIDAPAASCASSLTFNTGGSGTALVQNAINDFPPVDYAIEYIFYKLGSLITGGTYTLTAYGQTTAAIAYNASAATVLAAINLSLTNLVLRGAVSVTVNSSFNYNGDTALLVYVDVVPRISGGTYTITMFAQTTTALAYNASAATVQAALNALTEITKRGGCTVSGAGFHDSSVIDFTIAFSNPAVSGDATSLTPANSTLTPAISDAVGAIQTVTFSSPSAVRSLYVEDNGIATTDSLYAKIDGVYTLLTAPFTLPDGNLIVITLTPGSTFATGTAITEVGKRTKQNYSPGLASIRASSVTTFYLPGASAGITTADDIPIPTAQSDAAPFLQAAFAGTGSINYAVGQLAQWLNSPILALQKTTILASDV